MACLAGSISTMAGGLTLQREHIIEAIDGLDEDLRHRLAAGDYQAVADLAIAIERLTDMLRRIDNK